MLKGYLKKVNLSAVSMVDISGEVGTPILIMNASFGKDGNVNFGETVQNPDAYSKHFDEAIRDNAEFKKMVKDEYEAMYGKSQQE